MGATNRRDDLDKALLRPGRFDVEVRVPIPDFTGRKEILDHYLRKIKLASDVDVESLARRTTGFTGADLENLVNQVCPVLSITAYCLGNMYFLRPQFVVLLMAPIL